MAEKGKKEKHEEQVQFAAYKQFCDDTTVEKQRAIKEATAKMEQLVAAIQKAEADAATLAKEIAQLDEDISVYEGDKKAATEVNRRFFFLQGRVLLREKLPARGQCWYGIGANFSSAPTSPFVQFWVRDWHHFFVTVPTYPPRFRPRSPGGGSFHGSQNLPASGLQKSSFDAVFVHLFHRMQFRRIFSDKRNQSFATRPLNRSLLPLAHHF